MVDYWWVVPLVVIGVVFFVFRARRVSRGSAPLVMANPGVQHIDPVEVGSVAVGDRSRMSKSQQKRRSAAIVAYVGFNGSGKTLTMIWDTLEDLRMGRPVLSTVALLALEPAETQEAADAAWVAVGASDQQPPPDKRPRVLPHPLWIPFKDWRQLLTFKNGVVLMDEVTGIADSRDSMGLPVQVRNKLYQLRRDDVVLRWSTLDWASADKRIRDATQLVNLSRGFFPKFAPGTVWPVRRLFWVRSFDARGFDNFTEARNRTNDKHRPKPVAHQLARGLGAYRIARESYDSLAPVLALGAAAEGGLCMTCGGTRRKLSCSCADHKTAPKGKRGAGADAPTGGAAAAQNPNPADLGTALVHNTDGPPVPSGLHHLPPYVAIS